METILENNFEKPLNGNGVTGKSYIKDYLRDKTIFVTGGFGFVGKLLVEKLLKCEVKKIFMLVRPKKGKTLEERFQKFMNEPVFAKLLQQDPKCFSRIVLISGDLQKLELGISTEHQSSLIDEVEIVYHAAADVRFDEDLREAVEINIRGTREIMLLSQRIRNLNVFIYVSTAFCTPTFDVRENFYHCELDPDFMIKVVENLKPKDYDNFEFIARRMIRPYPNTYTYSKALSEHIVRKYGQNINVAVIRPSIITTTLSDPIPGYTDNVYGVNGVVAGAGVGVLRIFHIGNNLKANIIPADYVVNGIIALSWYSGTRNNFNSTKLPDTRIESISNDEHIYRDYSDEKIKIYHCTISNTNPVTWGDVKRETTDVGMNYPIQGALWVVTYNTTQFFYLSQFLKIFYHFIPALIIDSWLKLSKKEPKLLKVYRKVNKFSEVLGFFTNNEWNFEDKNMKGLCHAMSEQDKKVFPCNVENIRWRQFFEVFVLGLRTFICKETLDNLEGAKRRYRRMKIMHYILMAVIYTFLAFAAFKVLDFYGFVDLGLSYMSKTRKFIKINDK